MTYRWIEALTIAFATVATMTGVSHAADPVPVYTLPQVIGLALERHPSVASAEGLIAQNMGDRVAAGAYPNPTISAYGGHGILRDGAAVAAAVVVAEGREQLTEYNATIGQPLEWPAKRQARQRAAEAGLAGASVGLVETRLILTADVKTAFYELLLAQQDLDFAKRNLEIVEDVHRIVRTRVRLGEAPQFEAIKAEVEVLKAKQAVTRAENIVRVRKVTLDTLTAGGLGERYTIEGDFSRFPGGLSMDTLLRQALESHPTITRVRRTVEQADRTIQFERENRVPNVTVNGSYVREIGREAVMAGITVPAPFWYQRQGEIAGAMGAKRRQEAELLRVRNELVRAVSQHYQEATTTAELVDVFEKGLLRQAQEALRIAQFSFKQGASSLLEVLDAQRVLRGILFDYVSARFDLSIAVTRLERAVGNPLTTM